ncbi:MAG: radical SAM protein, partial [Myxococcota bacterium]
MLPLDHPHADRPHRVYVAVTNHCNRSCPWCSTCSSPAGVTWIDPRSVARHLPDGPYELQLEGGEPTLHPSFWRMIEDARRDPRCARVVVCTNGVALPRRPDRLDAWVDRLGVPVTLKLSINHHLLDHDPGLLALAGALVARFHPDAPGAGGGGGGGEEKRN